MANPTPAEIDAAVPPSGVPSRALTNDVLKRIATTAQAGENAASFVQRVSPTDGSTLTVLQNRQNGIVVIEGAGPLDTLIIQLPTGEFQREGQITRLVSMIEVSSVTFMPPSIVNNPPTELFMGDAHALQNIGTDEWVRTTA
jgi:hypothetical protein